MSKPHEPCTLPLTSFDCVKLLGLVGKANAALARYDGLLQGIINPSVLLSPLTTQEAVLSSRIEGTQATLDEVLEHEAGNLKEGAKAVDIQEIVNYRKALTLASEHTKDYPINLGLIRHLHALLMDSVRGQDKTPGEFRKDQNWIGRPGSTIEEASFIPPSPLILQDVLQNWADYLQYDDIDPLIQTAIVHAQFEIIHPFKDGNGRIGRLLIPLFLYQKRTLSSPMFYLSSFLEKNRTAYYDCLRAISQQGNWTLWIQFFLQAIIEQSKINTDKAKQIMELYDDMKHKITAITHSQYAIQILDALFNRPIFQTTDFIETSGVPKPSATLALRQLRENNILQTVREASGRRPAVLSFPPLLTIADE